MGLSSALARARASGPQGYQSTGLFWCWSRYGLDSWARRLGMAGPAGFDNNNQCKRTESIVDLRRGGKQHAGQIAAAAAILGGRASDGLNWRRRGSALRVEVFASKGQGPG